MIIGVGCDIQTVAEIRRALSRTENFLNKVFTQDELKYCCDGRGSLSDQSLAARWAAKEAVYKALGGKITAFNFHDIEVCNLHSGQPILVLKGGTAESALALDIKNWHLTISHTKENALAFVVAEG